MARFERVCDYKNILKKKLDEAKKNNKSHIEVDTFVIEDFIEILENKNVFQSIVDNI